MTRAAGQLSNVLIVLHEAGGRWHALAAAPRNGGLDLVDSTTFGPSEVSRLATWVEEQQPQRVLRVLPARNVICRTIQIPDASPEQLSQALDIQMDTFLASAAPAHRRAMAVLPKASGDETRSGVLVAWPERATVDELPIECETTFAPDVAAIAGLLGSERTDDPILFADRSDGSVALAFCHAPGVVFRASRETTTSDEDFHQDTRLLIAESAMNAGRSDEQVESLVQRMEPAIRATQSGGAQLQLPESIRRGAAVRLHNAPDEATWWSSFGIAAGAALLTVDDLTPLASIQREKPIEHPTAIDRAIGALSNTRTAVRLAVAALIILILAPLAFAGGRYFLLKQQVGDLNTFNQAQDERELQMEIYRGLREATWPMQKLLADISNAAPPGLIFRSVNLNETTNKVDIQGEAETQLQVNEMVRRMLKCGVFGADVKSTFSDRDDGGKPAFTITAKVVNPYHVADWEEDFGEITLAMHLYPDAFERLREIEEQRNSASRPEPSNGGDDAEDDESDMESGTQGPIVDASNPAGRSTDSGNGDGSPFGRTGPRTVRPRADIPAIARDPENQEPPKLPEMLTQEEMDALSRQELVIKMVSVSNAMRTYPNLTDEQKEELSDQFNLMREVLQNKPR